MELENTLMMKGGRIYSIEKVLGEGGVCLPSYSLELTLTE